MADTQYPHIFEGPSRDDRASIRTAIVDVVWCQRKAIPAHKDSTLLISRDPHNFTKVVLAIRTFHLFPDLSFNTYQPIRLEEHDGNKTRNFGD